MSTLGVTTVDLARIQFATPSLYHVLLVPLTFAVGPLVAVMETLWYRGRGGHWTYHVSRHRVGDEPETTG
jgi:cytochrome d ubiquinol oxidase subunit I